MANTIPVLKQAIRVLNELALGRIGSSTKELSSALEISHSTCYRIMQTFLEAKWLESKPDGEVCLSYGLLPVVHAMDGYARCVRELRFKLEKLSLHTGFSSKLSIKQGNQALSLVRGQSPEPMAVTASEGTSLSVLKGSSGAVLLSALSDTDIEKLITPTSAAISSDKEAQLIRKRVEQVRKNRYCLDEGSYHPQIHACSVPVLDSVSMITSALTVIGWPGSFSRKVLKELLPELEACATECADLLHIIHAKKD